MKKSYDIPDFFTPEWYREQKKLRRIDSEIANDLMISKPLLDKWKREKGCVGLREARVMSGRKPSYPKEGIVALYKEIGTVMGVARATGLNHGTVRDHLRLVGLVES